MRADALANRLAILAAARRLFAIHGGDVSFNQIATHAGVGIATLYRHFATPADLRRGLLAQAFTDIQALEKSHLEAMAANPQRGWHDYLRALAGLQISSWLPNIAGQVMAENVDDLRVATLASIDRVLDVAKKAGLVRSDVSAAHFQVSVGVLTRPLDPVVETFAPHNSEWLLEVFERGLRP